MDDLGKGDASGQSSSSVSPRDIEKEKVLMAVSAAFDQTKEEEGEEIQMADQTKEEEAEKIQMADQTKKEEAEEFQMADWNDPIVCQLEELLLHNLKEIFSGAIKKIVECGYTEEVAKWVVLRNGPYYGLQIDVLTVMQGSLILLKRDIDFDTSSHVICGDLQKLVEYTMLKMIMVLRRIRPNLSVSEAMWCLLFSDFDLYQACAGDEDASFSLGASDVPKETSSSSTLPQLKPNAQTSDFLHPSKPHIPKHSNHDRRKSQSERPSVSESPNLLNFKTPLHCETTIPDKERLVSLPVGGSKLLDITGGNAELVSQMTAGEQKYGIYRKYCSRHEKRDKCCKGHTSKGAFKANLASLGGLVMENKMKSPSNSSGLSKVTTAVGATALPAEGSHHLSCDRSSVSPVNTEVSQLLPTETIRTAYPQISTPPSSKTSNYYARIPSDDSTKEYVPQDDKDEVILTLVPKIQALQKELQGWSDWANEKVMKVARKLGKEQAELKVLRQEKKAEKSKKELQILDENSVKRLSEMEYALRNANGQIETATLTTNRLEVEKTIWKKEMVAAVLEASREATNLQEAKLREQEALKKAQLCDSEKGLLQEESAFLKCEVAGLQQALDKAKGRISQFEALWKHEEKEKAKVLSRAISIRKERERLDCLAKEGEDNIILKAEHKQQEYEDRIKNLEKETAALRIESESSKIAALRKGIDLIYNRTPSSSMNASVLQGYKDSKVHKRLPVFRDNFGGENMKLAWECVMCMTEEMSVVFLPCAHQVLCAGCSERHEKQGMNDCPSCRTPIRWRFNARFAKN